jgi:hypothetical protein
MSFLASILDATASPAAVVRYPASRASVKALCLRKLVLIRFSEGFVPHHLAKISDFFEVVLTPITLLAYHTAV